MRGKCPNCGGPVQAGDPPRWFPFCSDRCRLIDLGAWLDDSRRIPAGDGTAPPEAEPDTTKH